MKKWQSNSRKLRTALLVCGSLCATHAYAQDGIASRLNATVSPFVGYDTNAALVADNAVATDAESMSAGVVVSAGYQLYRNSTTEVALQLGGFALFNTDLDNFDVTSLRPALALRQSMSIAGRPAQLTAELGLESVQLSGDDLNQSTAGFVAAGIAVRVNETLSVGGKLHLADVDFEADGFDPAITSRDTSRVKPSVYLAYRLPATRTRLTASLDFVSNDADGSDFVYDALGYGITIEHPFVTPLGPLRAQVGAHFVDRDYDEHSASPQRQQDLFGIRASVNLQIRSDLSVFANTSWTDSDASIDAFSYDRVRTSLGLSWSF